MRSFWKHILNFLITHGTYYRPESLDDEAFYQTYYGDTVIPRDIVIRLRNYFVDEIGSPKHLVTPEYDPFDDELDLADLIEEIEVEFGISVPEEEIDKLKLDNSFGGFVQAIYRCCSPKSLADLIPENRHDEWDTGPAVGREKL